MNAEKWHYSEIRIAISDESQGSIAKNLTCARKPTRVSLIYPTETTTKKCKTEKVKRKNGYAQE